MSAPPVVIIGAGIGGLSAAIHLAAAGRKVVILEKNRAVGGKMAEFTHAGYRWDTGPSLITMRSVFENLFQTAGENLSDYLELTPVDPLKRIYFQSGICLDVRRDLPSMLKQIESIDPLDVEGYLNFLSYAARLYRITAPLFIFDHPPRLSSILHVSPRDACRFDGLRTMDRAIAGFVRSAELRQMLGLFATYVGASPYLAPATLNVIAHVEINEGLWYPRGGVYRIAEAFFALANKLGVEIRTDQHVEVINTENGAVIGVQTQAGDFQPASAVIANFDVDLAENLLHPQLFHKTRSVRDQTNDERSCSAFVILLGVRGVHSGLIHHNTFFSRDYLLEFNQMFSHRIPPEDPTIYVSITSKSSPSDAPEGCENWFIQVNVPAVSISWDWEKEASSYVKLVLQKLADRDFDIRDSIEQCHIITPLDIETRTGAKGGALYGQSSNNRWSAFRRPPNRSKFIRGLYFAGGTTHPGGGVPMVTLSGKIASEMLLNDFK